MRAAQVGRHRAQREGMADRDLAVQARAPRCAAAIAVICGDAAFAAVMQMDVDADAAPFGDAEDRIEMAIEIAVDADGIEAAHKVGALGDRGIQQIGGAGRASDAALREGHDLDGDEVAEALAHLQDLMRFLRPSWLSMSTCCACAACRWPAPAAPDWRRSPSRAWCARRAPAFGLDAVGDAVARAWLGTHGRPSRVLSRWMWPSTSGGRTSAPARSSVWPGAAAPRLGGGRRSARPRSRCVAALPSGRRGVGEQASALLRRRLAPASLRAVDRGRARPWPSGRSRWRWCTKRKPMPIIWRRRPPCRCGGRRTGCASCGGRELLVDRQDLRLLAVELRHQAERQAEVGRADIDAADARHVEDGVDIVDRLLRLDHRDDQHLVVGGRLVGRRLAVGAGADRAVAALALRRIERIARPAPWPRPAC